MPEQCWLVKFIMAAELFFSSQLRSTPRFVGAWDLLTGIRVGKGISMNVDL